MVPRKQSRRDVLATLSAIGAAGLATRPDAFAQEPPPETGTIRLYKMPGICIAPQYVAEEMLKSEGFSDIQYTERLIGGANIVVAATPTTGVRSCR